MIVVDVNLLLYAYDSSSSQHSPAKTWWQKVLSSTEIVGLPWHIILGFIRIATNHRLLKEPFSLQEATEIVDNWLSLPMVKLVEPGAILHSTDRDFVSFPGLAWRNPLSS